MQVGYPIRGVFGRTQRYLMAVNSVSFEIYPGETLGLVGESGCGKSTLARTLLRLVKPMGGQIIFEGQDVMALGSKPMRQLRREMQIIFQDPFSSLDPRMTIGEAVAEPLKIHSVAASNRNCQERVSYLLERVGLDPVASIAIPMNSLVGNDSVFALPVLWRSIPNLLSVTSQFHRWMYRFRRRC